MIQLACIFDGGLCIVAIFGGTALLGALGIKIGKTKSKSEDEKHTHFDAP